MKGMKRFHSRLYICCGIEVVVAEVAKDIEVARKWRALDKYVTYRMLCIIKIILSLQLYCIAGNFREVKFSRMNHQLTFCSLSFED